MSRVGCFQEFALIVPNLGKTDYSERRFRLDLAQYELDRCFGDGRQGLVEARQPEAMTVIDRGDAEWPRGVRHARDEIEQVDRNG